MVLQTLYNLQLILEPSVTKKTNAIKIFIFKHCKQSFTFKTVNFHHYTTEIFQSVAKFKRKQKKAKSKSYIF